MNVSIGELAFLLAVQGVIVFALPYIVPGGDGLARLGIFLAGVLGAFALIYVSRAVRNRT